MYRHFPPLKSPVFSSIQILAFSGQARRGECQRHGGAQRPGQGLSLSMNLLQAPKACSLAKGIHFFEQSLNILGVTIFFFVKNWSLLHVPSVGFGALGLAEREAGNRGTVAP